MISEQFVVNFSVNSERIKDISADYFKIFESIPKNTLLFLSNDYHQILSQQDLQIQHKIVPLYPILRNNPNFSAHSEIAQIDQSGNTISSYICPNNPKLESLIEYKFKEFCKSPHIAGIQLEGMEMPPFSSQIGCFCPYCAAAAEKSGIDLPKIADELTNKAKKEPLAKNIEKEFPDWLKFRMESITNLAGKFMIHLRKLNPDLFLGLNLNFSETPELLGQDYFFLALYLDVMNYHVHLPSSKAKKSFLKQLELISQVRKKFIGYIRVFLQIEFPIQAKSDIFHTVITKTKRLAFDGLIFPLSALDTVKKVYLMGK